MNGEFVLEKGEFRKPAGIIEGTERILGGTTLIAIRHVPPFLTPLLLKKALFRKEVARTGTFLDYLEMLPENAQEYELIVRFR